MKLNILIATGIYPPRVGGPAQYSKQLFDTWSAEGHHVTVKTFGRFERILPLGLRHGWYFLKIIPSVLVSDVIIINDTFSAAVPAVIAGKLLGKKTIIRTGGDFLWEWYLERTKKKVMLSHFYMECLGDLNFKEKIIFKAVRFALLHSTALVFSTTWQRDIFMEPYGLAARKNIFIIENFYGIPQTQSAVAPLSMRIYGVTRPLSWKNLEILRSSVAKAAQKIEGIYLEEKPVSYSESHKLMQDSRLVALVSLGDISPNMILEAISLGVPCIVTTENGLTNRIGDFVTLVNPLDEEAITEALTRLADPEVNAAARKKLADFAFSHSWREIASEFITIYHSLS